MKISHKTKHLLRNMLFAFVGFGALVAGSVVIWISTIKLPDFTSFDSRKESFSSKIYDRTGEVVLYDIGSDVRRTAIPYTEMGATIKNAVVAIEDSNFYEHDGIQIKSMGRALLADIAHGGAVQGGSTITQQVIKKSLLTDDKTPVRKIKEIILALKLERDYTKDEILGIYLNQNPYGGNIYGIEEATRAFFGKAPAELTLAEAAYIAAIPNAPSRFSPYGSHRDDLDNRKNLVLSRERTLGFITEEQYQSALSEVVEFKPQTSGGIKAPHFVFFIKDYLEQKYGVDTVESGGLRVTTTIDFDLQKIAEESVEKYTLGDKKQIEKQNAGLVAIDPKTGQILAMVGSRNYFDKEIDGNFNVTTARRQPGSSFKPYVYATALKQGYTAETVLFDVPTEFNSGCDPYGNPRGNTPASQCYNPQNYDGRFHGPMTMRQALARSMNVPAVKMLYMVGINNTIKTAQDMGITTLTEPSRYGLALVLGGGEVRLLEMTSAYGTFAAEGVRHPSTGVLTVTDRNGKVLETWQDNQIQVLPKNVALTMSSMLSDNPARTPTFGANSALYFPDRQVAAKTGTTNNFKDSWTVGYTPSLVAGVWMGKNDNTPMPVAVTAAPLWHLFMAEALKKYPNEAFPKPDPDPDYASLPPMLRGHFEGGESFIVDTISGKLATDQTPKENQKEYVITAVHDLLHWVNKTDPRSGRPANPQNDPLYYNFETAVQNWWSTNRALYPTVTEGERPTEYDDVHTQGNAPQLVILIPTQNASVPRNETTTVQISATGAYPLARMDVFIGTIFIGSAHAPNFSLSFTPSQIPGIQDGMNTLSIIGTDTVGGKGTVSQSITIN